MLHIIYLDVLSIDKYWLLLVTVYIGTCISCELPMSRVQPQMARYWILPFWKLWHGEIQLQHFHQWLMSCCATYWLSDSSFLSEAIVLHFLFHFSFVKTRTNTVKAMNNVGEAWIVFSNLFKIWEIRLVFVCMVGLKLSKHNFTH